MAAQDSYASTATLSQNVHTYYQKKMLAMLHPTFVLHKFGNKDGIPMNEGNAIQWSRYTSFDKTSEPSAGTEGATGTSVPLSAVNVSATLAQYKQYTIVTKAISLMGIDPKVEGILPEYANHAAWTIHRVICQALDAGGTSACVNSVGQISALASSDVMSAAAVRLMVRNLEKAFVPTHKATPGFYPVFMSADQKYDFMGDTATGGKIDITKYTSENVKDLELNKMGDIWGAKCFMINNPTAYTSGAVKALSTGTVHAAYAIGDGAFGNVEVAGPEGIGDYVSPHIIVTPLTAPSINNPFHELGSIAYFLHYVAKVLEAARVRVMLTRYSA